MMYEILRNMKLNCDFYLLVQKDLTLIGLNFSDLQIKNYDENKFKTLVRRKAFSASRSYLLKMKNTNKLKT